MISSPRCISLCRSESVSRLRRGRYFSTIFEPDDLVSGAPHGFRSGFSLFTATSWQLEP